MKYILFLLVLFFSGITLQARNMSPEETAVLPDTVIVSGSIQQEGDTAAAPARFPKTGFKENKKLIAAICAFPPFGLFGLHRIYLKSAPYVPVVYLCTIGGAGVLALIDFVVILLKTPEEIEAEFVGNNKIFMWVK